MKQTYHIFCLVVLYTVSKNNADCLVWEKIFLNGLTKNGQKDGNLNSTEKFLNATELMKFYGYNNTEEHSVNTEDGYVLNMVRIPANGPAVLIIHGNIGSVDDFITSGPKQSLPFCLAAAGYDVWLGNTRGNKYSKKHETLSTEDSLFWNYTFHEIGIYDLPAMINFTLEKANKTQVTYIGHSQGTTAFFVMASLRPEYGKVIKTMISLATIAWASHARSPVVKIGAKLSRVQLFITKLLGINEVLPSNRFTRFIFRDFCTTTKLSLLLCETILFLVSGFDYCQINAKQAPAQIAHFPSGSGNKQMVHLAQLVATGEFKQYDYGTVGNLKAYGTKTPPAYPVQNIKTPIAVIYGLNDWISDSRDVEIFAKNVHVFELYQVPHERWNHMDYLWGAHAKELVYDKILAIIKPFN